MKPRDYQQKAVNDIIKEIASGYKRIIFQLATGGGKTICLSYMLQRYFAKFPSAKVIVLVHRQELQNQTTRTLNKFGINNVSVKMVKTFCNQFKDKRKEVDGDLVGEVPIITPYDMIIIDECHTGEFRKVFEFYGSESKHQPIIIGFSATPISSAKKDPLKNYYQTIVCGVDINDLIKQKHLVPAIHYSAKNSIDKKAIKKTGGDYNIQALAMEYSKPRLVDAVVTAYEKYCKGKKTVIFNTTIEHAELVNQAFITKGYNSRSLDSTQGDTVRYDAVKWLKETPSSILNNVSILTTGFDEPTIEAVIFNRCTKSLPLWLQCCGRGARLSPETNKDSFIIIDLGDNIKGEAHDYWNAKHNWTQRFLYPDIPGDGVAPMKECPKCEAMIYMSATKCPFCEHEMPRETVYTDIAIELNLLPDYEIKRNSTIALEAAIKETANKIRKLQTPSIDRTELLKQSIIAIYDKQSFQLNNYILNHLLQIYGS